MSNEAKMRELIENEPLNEEKRKRVGFEPIGLKNIGNSKLTNLQRAT